MKLTTDNDTFIAIAMSAPATMLCVKARVPMAEIEICGPRTACGRIVHPMIAAREFLAKWTNTNLERAVRSMVASGEVTVIGHGWDESASERFVWTGSADEFCEAWEID